MPGNTTNASSSETLLALQSCAANHDISNAAFRNIAQRLLAGTTSEQTAAEPKATTEAAIQQKRTPAQAKPRAGAQRQARTGSKREAILTELYYSNGPLARGELLERMGLKGDKAGATSVSNILTATTKAGTAKREGRGYVIGNWTPKGELVQLPEADQRRASGD